METEKFTKRQLSVLVLAMAAMLSVSFVLGVVTGFFLKSGISSAASTPVTVNVNVHSSGKDGTEVQTVTVDPAQEETAQTETEKTVENTMLPISAEELAAMKARVEEDEAGYGDHYQTFTHSAYKRAPDRIITKLGDQDGFHIYEKTDAYYEHLLEVSEDRMFYSTCEDFNLWCFTPDSVDTMMTSGEQYIIFDYDNGVAQRGDTAYQKDLVFRYSDQSRLYRLVRYLSYQTELIARENLPKKEFASDTTISGYKYMTTD